jgi:hypothetical protein
MNKEVAINFIKEALRVAILGAVSALVALGLNELGAADQTNEIVIIGTLLLKGLDRAIHENKNTEAKGLLPF